jgi:hypothetical protein
MGDSAIKGIVDSDRCRVSGVDHDGGDESGDEGPDGGAYSDIGGVGECEYGRVFGVIGGGGEVTGGRVTNKGGEFGLKGRGCYRGCGEGGSGTYGRSGLPARNACGVMMSNDVKRDRIEFFFPDLDSKSSNEIEPIRPNQCLFVEFQISRSPHLSRNSRSGSWPDV